MIGAIAGDIIGSVYEHNNIKTTDFKILGPNNYFTDDTVLTVAVADCILNGKGYARTLKDYGLEYPGRGYGGMFNRWLHSDSLSPYNSYGNGSAMRVSPVGFAFDGIEKVMDEAKKSAEATHSHPEGIKGAQAVAVAVFLAKNSTKKDKIKKHIETVFRYDLGQSLKDLRITYKYSISCQETVPQAIIAFLESDDYEDAVRKVISIGGDSDTLACITGGIAEAYYKHIPKHIVDDVRGMLPPQLLRIVDMFNEKYSYSKIAKP